MQYLFLVSYLLAVLHRTTTHDHEYEFKGGKTQQSASRLDTVRALSKSASQSRCIQASLAPIPMSISTNIAITAVTRKPIQSHTSAMHVKRVLLCEMIFIATRQSMELSMQNIDANGLSATSRGPTDETTY